MIHKSVQCTLHCASYPKETSDHAESPKVLHCGVNLLLQYLQKSKKRVHGCAAFLSLLLEVVIPGRANVLRYAAPKGNGCQKDKSVSFYNDRIL